MVTARSYRELEVWKRAMSLVEQVYKVAQILPDDEKPALGAHLRRCAVSVPANIAEGCARGRTRELLHNLVVARAAIAELETLLLLTQQLGYTNAADIEGAMALCDESARMIVGFQRSQQRRLEGSRGGRRNDYRGQGGDEHGGHEDGPDHGGHDDGGSDHDHGNDAGGDPDQAPAGN